jgi:hypothetical protein
MRPQPAQRCSGCAGREGEAPAVVERERVEEGKCCKGGGGGVEEDKEELGKGYRDEVLLLSFSWCWG